MGGEISKNKNNFQTDLKLEYFHFEESTIRSNKLSQFFNINKMLFVVAFLDFLLNILFFFLLL